MEADWAPGCTNLERAEPDLGLNLVPPQGLPTPLRTVVKNAFGFGGINAALVLRRHQ
jgi:3-oxoacyl-[acyl-carrier-protein] synthase II